MVETETSRKKKKNSIPRLESIKIFLEPEIKTCSRPKFYKQSLSGRVAGALGWGAGFAGSMFGWAIYHDAHTALR